MTPKARKWLREYSQLVEEVDPLREVIIEDMVKMLKKGRSVTFMLNGQLVTAFVNRWDEITIAPEIKP
jgi:hypothetical protein